MSPELIATLSVLPFIYVVSPDMLAVDPRRFLVNLPTRKELS